MPLNALNAAEDEPLSSLQSSQSDVEDQSCKSQNPDVEDTEGRSPIIPIMYEEVVIPSDSEEQEEFLKKQKRSGEPVTPQSLLKFNLNNNENNNETPATNHVIPQSCKSQNRRNLWDQSDFTQDDEDSDYDPNKDKHNNKRFRPNMSFSTSDSNSDSDDHSEGPAKKKKKKSDDYLNQMKHVLNSIVDDKAKEESSIKIFFCHAYSQHCAVVIGGLVCTHLALLH